jgi:hypothetical protein
MNMYFPSCTTFEIFPTDRNRFFMSLLQANVKGESECADAVQKENYFYSNDDI